MTHKYSAVATEVDGQRFASKAEARRYQELRLLERTGAIQGLELQPSFLLQESFTDAAGTKHRAIHYVADFRYREAGRIIVEDVKGMATETFKIKAKLFRYKFRGIELRIT